MIDPLTKLAYAIRARPGGYVALLGSGVSRAAGVPTAWEVVETLIRRLPEAQDSEATTDPVAWFRQQYDRDLDFSSLLEALAPHSSDRASILQSVLGDPSPTEAHKSLARLARHGYVNIILTTNFDSLMENALYSRDLDPLVIATEAAAHNAEPLHRYSRPVVVKLHGDYKQPDSMLATEQELSRYTCALGRVLERAINEYGLIIVGWSGDYDHALRDAIVNRSPRYPLWYTQRENTPEFVLEMQTEGAASIVSATSADQMFSDLERRVTAIATYAVPQSSGVDALAAELKLLIAESATPLAIDEMVSKEIENCYKQFNDQGRFPYRLDDYREDERDEAVIRIGCDYLKTTDAAAHLMAIGCAWTGPAYHDIWRRAIERIANLPVIEADQPVSLVYLRELRNFPWMLLLYSGSIGAISRGKLDILQVLCRDAAVHDDFSTAKMPLVAHEPLAYYCCKYPKQKSLAISTVCALSAERSVDGLSLLTPVSEALYLAAREPARHLLPNDDEYAECFDRTELVLNLLAADYELTAHPQGVPRSLVDWPQAGPWPGSYAHPKRNSGRSMIQQAEDEMNSGIPFWNDLDKAVFADSGHRRSLALARIKELRSDWINGGFLPRYTC